MSNIFTEKLATAAAASQQQAEASRPKSPREKTLEAFTSWIQAKHKLEEKRLSLVPGTETAEDREELVEDFAAERQKYYKWQDMLMREQINAAFQRAHAFGA